MNVKRSEISSTGTSTGTTGTTGTSESHNATDPSLRDRAGDVYDTARTAAVEAYDKARDKAAVATAKAGDQIDEAPLVALAGGLAVGVVLAALLPRTERENRLLGPVGEKITGGAKNALEAAKEAGRDKMNELNLTRDAGSSALQTIIKGVGEAALGAGKRSS